MPRGGTDLRLDIDRMLLPFKRAFRSAWLSALLFAAAFVFWNYYPHVTGAVTSLL